MRVHRVLLESERRWGEQLTVDDEDATVTRGRTAVRHGDGSREGTGRTLNGAATLQQALMRSVESE